MSSLSEIDRDFSQADPSTDESRGAFQGDTGELPIDTRRVLVQLLMGPSVDARRQSQLWPILLRDEVIIRRRLHELFLDLVVDRYHAVAFTRQVVAEELEVPVLLRRAQLTFLDSILLLRLRQQLTEAEAHGERAVVSVDEMLEYLKAFERTGNTDEFIFAKRMQSSIDKLKQHSVLQKIRGSDERFEVSPTLKLLFSAEDILALTQVYRTMAETATAHTPSDERASVNNSGVAEDGEDGP